ncbi:MAG: hypothetical protein LBV12_04895 [Puniceicoccales bacterium]|jgi:regulator of RNase E activity RraA|nr:hypothetical protein [Puniceicoccales bacterium]
MALPVAKNPGWDGSFPMLGFRIVNDFDRVDPAIINDIASFEVTDVADLVGALYTTNGSLQSAYADMPKLIGTAFTVKCTPGDTIMVKKAVEMAQPGDVIVVDARGYTDTCLGGGNIAVAAQKAGVTGMVLDGAWRDIAEVEKIQMPIFLKAVQPVTGPKRGPGEINTPICCAGAIVEAGDIIVGDREGVVVIPRRAIKAVHEKLMAKRSAKPADPDAKAKKQQLELERRAYIDALMTARGAEIVEKL